MKKKCYMFPFKELSRKINVMHRDYIFLLRNYDLHLKVNKLIGSFISLLKCNLTVKLAKPK